MIKIQDLNKESYLGELTETEVQLTRGSIGFLAAVAYFQLGRLIYDAVHER